MLEAYGGVVDCNVGNTMVVIGGYPARDGPITQEARLPVSQPRAGGGNLVGVYALQLDSWSWIEVRVQGDVPRGLALFGCALAGCARSSRGCRPTLPAPIAASAT